LLVLVALAQQVEFKEAVVVVALLQFQLFPQQVVGVGHFQEPLVKMVAQVVVGVKRKLAVQVFLGKVLLVVLVLTMLVLVVVVQAQLVVQVQVGQLLTVALVE
jgi:hypothetical protein